MNRIPITINKGDKKSNNIFMALIEQNIERSILNIEILGDVIDGFIGWMFDMIFHYDNRINTSR